MSQFKNEELPLDLRMNKVSKNNKPHVRDKNLEEKSKNVSILAGLLNEPLTPEQYRVNCSDMDLGSLNNTFDSQVTNIQKNYATSNSITSQQPLQLYNPKNNQIFSSNLTFGTHENNTSKPNNLLKQDDVPFNSSHYYASKKKRIKSDTPCTSSFETKQENDSDDEVTILYDSKRNSNHYGQLQSANTLNDSYNKIQERPYKYKYNITKQFIESQQAHDRSHGWTNSNKSHHEQNVPQKLTSVNNTSQQSQNTAWIHNEVKKRSVENNIMQNETIIQHLLAKNSWTNYCGNVTQNLNNTFSQEIPNNLTRPSVIKENDSTIKYRLSHQKNENNHFYKNLSHQTHINHPFNRNENLIRPEYPLVHIKRENLSPVTPGLNSSVKMPYTELLSHNVMHPTRMFDSKSYYPYIMPHTYMVSNESFHPDVKTERFSQSVGTYPQKSLSNTKPYLSHNIDELPVPNYSPGQKINDKSRSSTITHPDRISDSVTRPYTATTAKKTKFLPPPPLAKTYGHPNLNTVTNPNTTKMTDMADMPHPDTMSRHVSRSRHSSRSRRASVSHSETMIYPRAMSGATISHVNAMPHPASMHPSVAYNSQVRNPYETLTSRSANMSHSSQTPYHAKFPHSDVYPHSFGIQPTYERSYHNVHEWIKQEPVDDECLTGSPGTESTSSGSTDSGVFSDIVSDDGNLYHQDINGKYIKIGTGANPLTLKRLRQVVTERTDNDD